VQKTIIVSELETHTPCCYCRCLFFISYFFFPLSHQILHSLLLSGNKPDWIETFNTMHRMVSIHSQLLFLVI